MSSFGRPLLLSASFSMVFAVSASAETAKDLNPVTLKPAPTHAPIVLVENGQPKASICVMSKAGGPLSDALQELKECIEEATGAKLPVLQNQLASPAIVLGDCEAAAAAGLVGSKMPVEGFAIKTTAEHVFIVGNDEPIPDGGQALSAGTAWGVFEFLERFVDVRWYYPTRVGGRSIVKRGTLAVPPVWLEDAPVFRKREIWPPCGIPWNGTGEPLGHLHTCLRHNNSWPITLVVHSPNWEGVQEYREKRPEVFQMRSDGTRDFAMLCYGNPKTLETYLENISLHFDKGQKAHLGIVGNAITVSPNDMAIACYCDYCRKLWDKDGGQYGTASRILADFVNRLALEVKKRWPDKTVIFLPYMNYTTAPEGYKFPGNVEVQICGMPGIAQHKEPGIQASEQANIDRWVAISGRKIQNWHYSCWPADKTQATYQYPHVVKRFYQENRDKVVGTFINGTEDHWPRFHVSLYCWMKALWNPDFDVDAAISEYCRRMYGPAAQTMQELVTIQTDGWEKSRWPGGRLSPKGIYEASYPKESVERMLALLKKAREEAGADALILKHLDYYEKPFEEFIAEWKAVTQGEGQHTLMAQKVAETPKIDGKLDDEVWKQAPEANLYLHAGGGKEAAPKYPTRLKAIWGLDGITFGFHNADPAPQSLVCNIKSRDDSMAWWQDNVEIFIDVTGKKEGEFYQLIVTASGAIADFKNKDSAWNIQGEKIGLHVAEDSWGLEVYLPYSAFPDALRPGTGVEWFGQFTRHRMSNAGKAEGSVREYTRMNHKFGGGSANLADFAAIKFVE